ncbi:hypothetical protein [Magnetovibrio sp.]|uniref:hypothetical protein n=1 Tax=Magnetovibrio sp. TaxID=2024836 RepID=UPI002F938CE0
MDLKMRIGRTILQANIDKLETDNPQARSQVFLIGKLAMVVNFGDDPGDGHVFRRGELFKHIPKRAFQANGRGMTVNAQRPALRQKLGILIAGAAQAEQLIERRCLILTVRKVYYHVKRSTLRRSKDLRDLFSM